MNEHPIYLWRWKVVVDVHHNLAISSIAVLFAALVVLLICLVGQ